MDTKSTVKKFNLPSYINTPLFLYQDNRLDKAATIIASFFYSIHTSGKEINVSVDYLCALGSIKKRQLYKILNTLESCKYISRKGLTNQRKIFWTYNPLGTVIVEDLNTGALECTSDESLNINQYKNPTLVHSSALNYCPGVHIDNRVNNTTTTQQYFSSSLPSDEITPLELASVFEQELPENPQAMINKSNGSMEPSTLKAIREFKKWWFSETGQVLNEERFRKYLIAMKKKAPGFCHNEHPKSGRKAGIKQFVNWVNAMKLMNGEIY